MQTITFNVKSVLDSKRQKPLTERVFDRVSRMTNLKISGEKDFNSIALQGVSPQAFESFISFEPKANTSWIIPRRTLTHRVTKKQRFTMEETTKLLRAAQTIALAEEIFGNVEKAHKWLSKPFPDFDSKTPNEYMKTEFGAAMVRDALYRLNEGYFA
ncbi:antitoxin Xre/MbcA/ParS toxin-binding domain-containing protein [Marinomonas sp. TI.3.20]|uniref:antitoxin Xre/MbcA/ParS toxin-binding domain-containing protein n=1 Tax=Marinomonas sp. TI.3.20 TaxID=3121296 RepID=UPI00311E0180